MIFTIDWEPYFCYRPYSEFWEENDPLVEEPTMYLLDLLRRHQIKAIWYCLGWLKDKRPDLVNSIEKEGHVIGWHTYYHNCEGLLKNDNWNDPLFRAPRFEGQKRLYSGGFWFRVLPYAISKKLLEQSEIFYIHPHDVLLPENYVKPQMSEYIEKGELFDIFSYAYTDLKRYTGLKTVRDKLERLTRDVEFEDARKTVNSNIH